MAYRSFRQFLDALEQGGELKRVAIPVDTELLIAEWADREMKSPNGGKLCCLSNRLWMGKNRNFRSQLTPWGRAAAWPWRYRFPTLKMSCGNFSSPGTAKP